MAKKRYKDRGEYEAAYQEYLGAKHKQQGERIAKATRKTSNRIANKYVSPGLLGMLGAMAAPTVAGAAAKDLVSDIGALLGGAKYLTPIIPFKAAERYTEKLRKNARNELDEVIVPGRKKIKRSSRDIRLENKIRSLFGGQPDTTSQQYGIGGYLQTAGQLAGAGASIPGPIGIASGIAGSLLQSVGGIADMAKANHMKELDEMSKRSALTSSYSLGGIIEPKVDYLNGAWNSYNMAHSLGEKNFLNMKGLGGNNDLVEFNEGGLHEQNPNGGIPIGMGNNGKQNVAEEGETKWNDYIFSNRLKLTNPSAFNLHSKYKNNTFADVSKHLSKEAEERPYDNISKRGKESLLNRLKGASEQAREIEQMKQARLNPNQFGLGGYEDPLEVEDWSPIPDFKREIDERNSLLFPKETIKYGLDINSPNELEVNKLKDFQIANIQKVKNMQARNNGGISDLLRYAPVAYNAIAGLTLQQEPEVRFPNYQSMLNSKYQYHPRYMDETRGVSQIDSAYRGSLRSLKGASEGNAAALRSSIIGTVPGYLQSRENLYTKMQQSNINQYTHAQDANRQLGLAGTQLDANMRLQEENINASNRGSYLSNKYNLLGEAFTGLGGIGTENYWGEIAPRVSFGYDRSAKYNGKG